MIHIDYDTRRHPDSLQGWLVLLCGWLLLALPVALVMAAAAWVVARVSRAVRR